VISNDEFFSFLDEQLEGMIGIVTELGDDLANRRPDIPETNTPYQVLTHCLGVMEFWGGYVVSGRRITRDRDAEFVASGPVAELVDRARQQRARFADDVAGAEVRAEPRNVLPEPYDDGYATQGAVLVHVYEELAQHRGQMEGIRDVLLAPWAKLA
jgi:hypothetical protein